MLKGEMEKYSMLNELAKKDGIVIIGGTEDKDIPLCELKQAFELDSRLYNRSIENLSIDSAIEFYDDCIAGLNPESILLHIGAADLKNFVQDSSSFDKKYHELVQHIKKLDKKCNIAIISLRNPDDNSDIANMNKHLKVIAQSEQCEFGDIATKRVWNPKETKDVVSFVYSIGFVHPLKIKRPMYDLIKILFCSKPLVTE